MERKEYENNWIEYCYKFVPQKPDGFSAEKYLCDAAEEAFPQETQKDISQNDVLERISFNSEFVVRDEKDLSAIFQPLIDFLKNEKIKMAFDFEPAVEKPICVIPENSEFLKRDIWFIGDIHGDLLALKTVKAFIDSNSKHKPIYVLLGDLFDRNEFGLEVILEVVSLFKEHPDSVFMIAGNHDDGLSWENDKFTSSIIPCQFTNYLNLVDDELVSSFIREFIKHIKRLPIGMLFPNGLFVTHGGIPSRPDGNVQNVWENLDRTTIKEHIFNQRNQFMMNRFEKESLSGSKIGPSYSWREIINFSQAIKKVYGVEIRSLLRGHDHCKLCRHEWSKSTFTGNEYCQNPDLVRDVLTMTSMVFMDDNEKRFYKSEFSFPSVAHYVHEQIVPKVYSLELLKQDIESYYNKVKKVHGRNSANYIEKRILKLKEQTKELSDLLEKKLEELSPIEQEEKTKAAELSALEEEEQEKLKELDALEQEKLKELDALEKEESGKLLELDQKKLKELQDLNQSKAEELSALEQKEQENKAKLSALEKENIDKMKKSQASNFAKLKKLEKKYYKYIDEKEHYNKITKISFEIDTLKDEISDIGQRLNEIIVDKNKVCSGIESISKRKNEIEEEYAKDLGKIEEKYRQKNEYALRKYCDEKAEKEDKYDKKKEVVKGELDKITESKKTVLKECNEIKERKKPVKEEYNTIARNKEDLKKTIDYCETRKAEYSQWSNSLEGEDNDR